MGLNAQGRWTHKWKGEEKRKEKDLHEINSLRNIALCEIN